MRFIAWKSEKKPKGKSSAGALARFVRATTATVAVEFALLIVPLVFTAMAILEAGFDLYLRSSIYNVSQDVARQIFTGALQNTGVNGAPMTQAYFIKNVVCPKLPTVLTCSNVIVNVVNFAETASPTPYYTYVNATQSALVVPPLDNTKTTFCMGSTGSYVMLQILYPLPLYTNVFSSAPLATYNGQSVRVLFASAAFRNEPFPTPTYFSC